MSTQPNTPPSGARLVKATLIAAAVAALLLVTIVLPAEYDIDPTGIGGALGLGVLANSEDAAAKPATAPAAPGAPPTAPAVTDALNGVLAAKANLAFGADPKQAFDAAAVSQQGTTLSEHTLSLDLAPGKGAEVKATLATGEGLVYSWTATGDVAVDMHGEAPDANGGWTTYAAEKSRRTAAGTFIAPFDGTHGWYWKNEGAAPVTVTIRTMGFQPTLYRP